MVRTTMNDTRFLQDIHRFLARTGMAPSTFGRMSINDGKLVARLEAGGQVTLRTAARIQKFMSTQLSNRRAAMRAEASSPPAA